MLIFLTASARNFEEDLPFLRSIAEVIHDNDALLSRDWLNAAFNRTVKNKNAVDDKTDWDGIHSESIDALQRSDLAIIEATRYSFKQGFYTSQALVSKKPTLLVSRKPLKGRSASGIKHNLLTVKEYTTHEELRKIVQKFIKDNTIPTKDLRFNFFIDRNIYSYLREESYKTGKNKSEIIRELLEEEIEKRD